MTLYIERTGGAEGWNVAYYIFTTARGLLFFTVVVLIGAGWSYMKVGGCGLVGCVVLDTGLCW
jgi:hypothetical protein